MLNILRYLLQALVIRPLILGFLGMNLNYRERLPQSGPAVIVANHNSHLDALLIMTLFPLSSISRIRPVGAWDYFFKNPIMAWCVTHIFRLIPIRRGGFRVSQGDPLRECSEALSKNEILVIFPEGSRSEPGHLAPFKPGISHLVRRHPDVPVIPIFIHGLETVLPKGSFFPIPFVCDVYVGNATCWNGNKKIFMEQIRYEIETMRRELSPRSTNWLLSRQLERVGLKKQRMRGQTPIPTNAISHRV